MPLDNLGEVLYGEASRQAAEVPCQYMEETVKCPYLSRWSEAECRIGDSMYAPSAFQVEEYCRTEGHTKCPFYRAHIRATGRAVDMTRSAVARRTFCVTRLIRHPGKRADINPPEGYCTNLAGLPGGLPAVRLIRRNLKCNAPFISL